MLNPKFVRYEKNLDPQGKFLGIATVSVLDGKLILRYKVQPGKNGGIFIAAMSAKMNDEWLASHTLDSNISNEEINSLIKKGMNGQVASSVSKNDDSECPF